MKYLERDYHSKGFAIILVILIILILGLVTIGGSYYLKVSQQQITLSKVNPSSAIDLNNSMVSPTSVKSENSVNSNWEDYTDPTYGFTLKYPPNWQFANYSDLNSSQQFTDTRTFFFKITDKPPRKANLFVDIIAHKNVNQLGLEDWIKIGADDNFQKIQNATVDGQMASEGLRSPDTLDTLFISPPNKQGISFVYDVILAGNGGAISGGACAKDPCPTIDSNDIPQLYENNDPYLLKQISEYKTMLSTFKFTD